MLKQEELQKKFGRLVRNERKKNKFTQAELAERASLDSTYISQIERGISNPSLFIIHKIAGSLSLSEFEIYLQMKNKYSKRNEFVNNCELETIYKAIGKLNVSMILTANQKKDFKIIYCNNAFLKLTNRKREELIGRKLHDILTDGKKNSALAAFLSNLKNSTTNGNLKTSHEFRHNGHNKELEINVASVVDSENRIENYLFTLVDNDRPIEVAKNGDSNSAIKKYKALLYEAHHRIKNNLAIIVGILDMRVNNTDDKEVKSVLRDTQLKISSVAQIHELLLEPKTENMVSVQDYLEKLILVIEATYQYDDVIFNKNISEIELDMHSGVTLGLLCNELITNSYKYAFDGRSYNEIDLRIIRNRHDRVQFAYQDNGIGFKKELFEQADSLGFKLIQTFLDELKAINIQVESENGFKLQFEIEQS